MLLIMVITAAQTHAASGPQAACRAGLPVRRAAPSARTAWEPKSRQLPEQQELTRSVASWLGSQHAVPASPAASRSSPASEHCLLPARKGGNLGSMGKGHIPLENSSHAGVSGKAGCKTGMSFRECFQAMDLALEVLQRPSLSSAWDARECWGAFCGIFWRWGRTLVFLEALLHLPSVVSLLSFFEEK